MASIFERYGGFASIRRIVSDFYDRVLDDAGLSSYFHGVNLPELIEHQTKFIMMVTGGPANVPNEQLRRAHSRLSITSSDFERIVELLTQTLEDHNLQPEDVAGVISAVKDREAFIVTRTG